MSSPILKKTATGLWVTRDGFAGAIMLAWNVSGKEKSYEFIASPFDTIPHRVEYNGEDDAVLITENLLTTLIARGVARPMTDAEAQAANEADDLERDQINDENMKRQKDVEDQNKIVRETPAAKIDPSKTPQRTILPDPPPPADPTGAFASLAKNAK